MKLEDLTEEFEGINEAPPGGWLNTKAIAGKADKAVPTGAVGTRPPMLAVDPAPPSTATTPMGSIPQVGPGTATRPVTPSELMTGSLSSCNVVPHDTTADARVMSPNNQPNANQQQLARVPPQGVISQHDPNGTLVCFGYTGACRVCNELLVDPAMCAGCGIYGHTWCIGLCFFNGYQFCPQCLGRVRELHAKQTAHYWSTKISEQFHNAKINAINAAGLTLTVTTAVAGGAATLAGAGGRTEIPAEWRGRQTEK